MPQMEFADYAPQLIWLAITFITLYVLMSRVALPRIADVLEQRQLRVTNDLEQAAALRDEAAKALEAYEATMAEARSKAHAIAMKKSALPRHLRRSKAMYATWRSQRPRPLG